jgi:hypothetical protein
MVNWVIYRHIFWPKNCQRRLQCSWFIQWQSKYLKSTNHSYHKLYIVLNYSLFINFSCHTWSGVYRDITCVHMCLIMFNIQYFFVWYWLSNIKCNWCYPLYSEALENYNVWSRLYTHELLETQRLLYASAIVDQGSSFPADEHRFGFFLWWVHLTTCMIWIVIDAI